MSTGTAHRILKRNGWRLLLIWTFVLCAPLADFLVYANTQAQAKESPPPTTLSSITGAGAGVAASLVERPLYFETNKGQANAAVKYLAHGPHYDLFLTPTEAVISLQPRPSPRPAQGRAGTQTGHATIPTPLRLQFVGANAAPAVVGLDTLPGVVNYYLGNDPAQWQTGVATFGKVKFQALYPGVDLVFYGNGQEFEHDFVVAPGVDPSIITVRVHGAWSLRIDGEGNLLITPTGSFDRHSVGALRLRKPVIYQEIHGARRPVGGRFLLKGKREFGFAISRYDPRRTLVIDPVLDTSTYFGGNDDDYGNAIAVDGDGNIYLTGATNSTDFPLASPAQPAFGGGGIDCPSDEIPSRHCYDVFVTKLNAGGSALVYSTYLGDRGDDQGFGIAVDGAGNAYVTGQVSVNSEVLPEYYIYKYVFVAKLDPTGALVYNTGDFGNNGSFGRAIAVDGQGNAYVTGEAHGSDFPTTADALQPERLQLIDAFVSVINPDGDEFVYSTYLGGSGDYCGACYSTGYAIEVDSEGLIYVAGQGTPAFVTTADAYQPDYGGFIWDAFVAVINPAQPGAAGLVYGTFLGAGGNEFAYDLALDSAGKIYVTGATQSDDFPTTEGAYDTACGTDGICNATDAMVCDPVPPGHPPVCHLDSKADIFVVKLDRTTSGAASLVYSTFIGGMGVDTPESIAVDLAGNAYIAGETRTTDFPTVNPIQAAFGGGNKDVFVSKLNATGAALVYSTFLGGGGDEVANSIAVDAAGNAYLTGYTGSAAWPTADPLQPRSTGWEAFITKIAEPAAAPQDARSFLPLVRKQL
jgi:hypothetical protein